MSDLSEIVAREEIFKNLDAAIKSKIVALIDGQTQKLEQQFQDKLTEINQKQSQRDQEIKKELSNLQITIDDVLEKLDLAQSQLQLREADIVRVRTENLKSNKQSASFIGVTRTPKPTETKPTSSEPVAKKTTVPPPEPVKKTVVPTEPAKKTTAPPSEPTRTRAASKSVSEGSKPKTASSTPATPASDKKTTETRPAAKATTSAPPTPAATKTTARPERSASVSKKTAVPVKKS